jgi:hypothetical protein
MGHCPDEVGEAKDQTDRARQNETFYHWKWIFSGENSIYNMHKIRERGVEIRPHDTQHIVSKV